MRDPSRITWKSNESIEAGRILRRSSTRSEAIVWAALRNRKLEGRKFRRQHPIEGFVVDFCCVEERLVIEIDGPVHARSFAADEEREEALRSAGFRVLRLSSSEVEGDVDHALH